MKLLHTQASFNTLVLGKHFSHTYAPTHAFVHSTHAFHLHIYVCFLKKTRSIYKTSKHVLTVMVNIKFCAIKETCDGADSILPFVSHHGTLCCTWEKGGLGEECPQSFLSVCRCSPPTMKLTSSHPYWNSRI